MLSAFMRSGAVFGGGSQQQQSSNQYSNEPWGVQQPYEIQGFNQAQQNLNNGMANGPYTGQFVPGQNPYQAAAINDASAYAYNGYGASLPNTIASGVGGLYGASTPYVNNASSIASSGIAGPNSNLMNAITGYATGSNPCACEVTT